MITYFLNKLKQNKIILLNDFLLIILGMMCLKLFLNFYSFLIST